MSIFSGPYSRRRPGARAARWWKILELGPAIGSFAASLLGGSPYIFLVIVAQDEMTVDGRPSATVTPVYVVPELPDALAPAESPGAATVSLEVADEPNLMADENQVLHEVIAARDREIEQLGTELADARAENDKLRAANATMDEWVLAGAQRQRNLEVERDAALDAQGTAEDQWRAWRQRALRAEESNAQAEANQQIIGTVGGQRFTTMIVRQIPAPDNVRVGERIRLELVDTFSNSISFNIRAEWEIEDCDEEAVQVGGSRSSFFQFWVAEPATCRIRLRYGDDEQRYTITVPMGQSIRK